MTREQLRTANKTGQWSKIDISQAQNDLTILSSSVPSHTYIVNLTTVGHGKAKVTPTSNIFSSAPEFWSEFDVIAYPYVKISKVWWVAGGDGLN